MAANLVLRRVQRTLTVSTFNYASCSAYTTHSSSGHIVHNSSRGGSQHIVPVSSSVISLGKTELEPQTVKNSSKDELALSGILSKLSLSPTELNLTKEYRLPSMYPSFTGLTILDPLPQAQIRECPSDIVREIFERPLVENEKRIEDPSSRPIVEKQAKRILKIRRKKMKRHKYLKWRKRNKFKLRAMFYKRDKKKLKIWQKYLEGYKFKGLTPEYVDWYRGVKKEEMSIFLTHLGIPLEEESPEKIERREKAQKRREKKTYCNFDPMGSMKIYPTPILPEGSSLKKLFDKQEKRAKERQLEIISKDN